MAKLTLNDIFGQYASTIELNNNFALIEAALENTLSRDGTTPNTMSANLDMNSNDITNANNINAVSVIANGQTLVPSSVVAIDTAASVPNVAAGNIIATDVQAAINELDTEKVGLAGTETVTGDKTFSGATTLSGANSLSGANNLSGANTLSGVNTISGVIAGATPLIFEGATSDTFETTLAITDPTADRTLTVKDETGTVALLSDIYSYNLLKGLTLSNDTDTDHDVNITAGFATSSDNTVSMNLASETTKQIDAAWSTGDDAGGLSSSLTIAIDTWYHVFLVNIGGSVDVLFDTSLTCANGVADHTVTDYRRIGSVLTDGSANIIQFIQVGNHFVWKNLVSDSTTVLTTTASTITLSVPTGIRCMAKIVYSISEISSAALRARLFPTDVTDTAITNTNANIGSQTGSGTDAPAEQGEILLLSDTSAQIKGRSETLLTTTVLSVAGYEDFRGQE